MWVIKGMKDDGVVETIDYTSNYDDMLYLVSEYAVSFGNNWVIWGELDD